MCNPDHRIVCELADELGFDQNAVEDVVARSERTKTTRYATHTFLTVYALPHWGRRSPTTSSRAC